MPPKKRSRSQSAASSPAASQPTQEELPPTRSSPSPKSTATPPATQPVPTSPAKQKESVSRTPAANEENGSKVEINHQLPIFYSKVIGPDVIGIKCIAVDSSESRLLVARENGSFALYAIDYFQNIPHFRLERHTGGQPNRTITRVAFLNNSDIVGSGAQEGIENNGGSTVVNQGADAFARSPYFMASYLSGQIIIYRTETLFPVSVYQRTGGAIWDACVLPGTSSVFAAISDGSIHQLQLKWDHEILSAESTSPGRRSLVPVLHLQHVIPKVPGADRTLSVACSAGAGIIVGTDNAGNVTALRIGTSTRGSNVSERSRLSPETVWSTRLPHGMALCCAVGGGDDSGVPAAVVVGTSEGDVIVFDAEHGTIRNTFSQHKGPVTTVAYQNGAFFASGWHESLRSYRFSATDREWFPAEVKRRTHYHEASQVLVTARHQVLFSASRDGTIMHTPLTSAFTTPAVYLNVTTQQFAFARKKNILLQTRGGHVEAFRPTESFKAWVPLFSHHVKGRFYLNGLWCDEDLHHIFHCTDERATLLQVKWQRGGGEESLAIAAIVKVAEFAAGDGIVDCVFSAPTQSGAADDSEAHGSVYVLTSTSVIHILLAEGYPTVTTTFPSTRAGAAAADGNGGTAIVSGTADSTSAEDGVFRRMTPKSDSSAPPPTKMFVVNGTSLYVSGDLYGTAVCELYADGTPNQSSFRWLDTVITNGSTVPTLATSGNSSTNESTLVGLCDGARYMSGLEKSTNQIRLPRTLPHDTRFVAVSLPLAAAASSANGEESAATTASKSTASQFTKQRPRHLNRGIVGTVADGDGSKPAFVGVFSRGLLYATQNAWHMVKRVGVEAAFVVGDGSALVVLERNVEALVEALPMCWKVRRFGN